MISNVGDNLKMHKSVRYANILIDMQNRSHLRETYFSYKTKILLSYGSTIIPLGIYPKELKT